MGGAEQSRRPRYKGCTNDFGDFQNFVEWHHSQVGHDTPDYQIDKDIISKSNLVYGPEQCIIVPRQLNMLVVSEKGKRGNFPIGVSFDKARGVFVARMSVAGHTTVIDCWCETPEQAFNAYKTAKEAFIKQQAAKWRDKIDPRAYEALMNYTVEITD